MISLTTFFLLLLLFSPDFSSANTQLCGEQQQESTLGNSTTKIDSETKEEKEEDVVDNINGTKNIPVIDSKKKMLALLRSAYVRDQMEAIKPQSFKPAFARNVTEFTVKNKKSETFWNIFYQLFFNFFSNQPSWTASRSSFPWTPSSAEATAELPYFLSGDVFRGLAGGRMCARFDVRLIRKKSRKVKCMFVGNVFFVISNLVFKYKFF